MYLYLIPFFCMIFVKYTNMKMFVGFVISALSIMFSNANDTLNTIYLKDSSNIIQQDTIDNINSEHFKKRKKYPPQFDSLENRFVLRNESANFGRKLMRSSLLVLGFNSGITSLLMVMPEDISKWNKKNYKNQFKKSYTSPPVFDKDKWYINYVGHPYQGTIYYNSLRSQGAKAWQAALFGLGSIALWEYTIEAGFEQPSIQDLIVTPVAGALLGELFHFSTIKMSKNGYKWYEKAFVSFFNPAFAINNGFKWSEENHLRYEF